MGRSALLAADTAPGARIYEITGPGDWIALVARYPLEVTNQAARLVARYRVGWHLADARLCRCRIGL
jgi:hypothetical protein